MVTISIAISNVISDKRKKGPVAKLMNQVQFEFQQFQKIFHRSNKNGCMVTAAQKLFKKIYELRIFVFKCKIIRNILFFLNKKK